MSLEIQGPVEVKVKEVYLPKEAIKGQVQNSMCCKSAATGKSLQDFKGHFNHFKTFVIPVVDDTHDGLN